MSIKSFMTELLGLDNAELRRVEITMKVSANAAGQFTPENYRVPAGHKLVITGIRGHIALLTAADWATLTDVPGLLMAKSMNVNIKLENNDTHDLLTENEDLNLATLLNQTSPQDWEDVPHTVPSGQSIKMVATLVSNDPALITNTEYGVVLSGFLIRKD